MGSYYLYTKQLDITLLLPAFSVGFLSIGVLNLNNMRDRASDMKSGKRTLVVKIGSDSAKYYHYYLLIIAYLFALLYTIVNYTSPFQLLFLITLLPIIKHFKVVYNNKKPKLLDPELKKLAITTFLFSILFGLGLVL